MYVDFEFHNRKYSRIDKGISLDATLNFDPSTKFRAEFRYFWQVMEK